MIIALLGLFALICVRRSRNNGKKDNVTAYIQAAVVWMLFCFAVTEALSAVHGIRFRNLFILWGIFDLVLVAMLGFRRTEVWKLIPWDKLNGSTICAHCRKNSYYLIIVIIGASAGLLALVTVPHNWDSMTYHLSRITYWVQNQSVEHYATNSIREISSPVLAEFVNLHVYVLCRGSDQLLNMLQWFSYLTNAVMVLCIARRLGCNRLFSFIAMLLYMTMPIAYAEALTTQVDNFAAMWLLFFVYLVLDLTMRDENIVVSRDYVSRVCTMGACVAWGYLTKPSVCFAMVFFAMWLLIVCIRRRDRAKHLLSLALCALPCVVLPLLPEVLRNFRTFHAYADPSVGAKQLVGTLQPSYLFVNFLKNFTFNLPTALIRDSHNFLTKIARKAASLLSVELDDPSIAENGLSFGLHAAPDYGADTAINPLVMWLFCLCILISLVSAGSGLYTRRHTRKSGTVSAYKSQRVCGYMLTASLSFCVFCMILRWEPFVTRYMLAYLALLCPAIAVWIQKWSERNVRGFMQSAVVGVVIFLCLMEAVSMTRYYYDIYAYQGADRRSYGYFVDRREELGIYVEMIDDIRGQEFQNIGLYLLKDDAYEYPIWAMLNGQRMEHVLVRNRSSIYTDTDYTPDCIIWTAPKPEDEVVINGKVYDHIEEYGDRRYLLW